MGGILPRFSHRTHSHESYVHDIFEFEGNAAMTLDANDFLVPSDVDAGLLSTVSKSYDQSVDPIAVPSCSRYLRVRP